MPMIQATEQTRRISMLAPNGRERMVANGSADRRIAAGWKHPGNDETASESADNGAEFADRETAYNPGRRLVYTKGQEARAREQGPDFLAFLERLGLEQVTKSDLDEAIDMFAKERAA